MKKRYFRVIITMLLLSLSACNAEQDSSESLAQSADQTGLPAITATSPIMEAKGFDIILGDGFHILQIMEGAAGAAKTVEQEILLLPYGNPVPEQYSDLALINTPIKRLITSSTTQISLLTALGAQDVLIGHADRFVWDARLRDKFASHQITTVGVSANLNVEVVLALNPDVYMAVAHDNSNSYSLLTEAGIAILPNAEYLESTLLGRAEWIKVMGLLLDKENTANQLFLEMRDSYGSLKELTKNVAMKPQILPNTPFRGTWYVPGGGSYIAQLIQDAGGAYYWQDNADTGSLVISFEEMLALGLESDIWINPVSDNALLTDVLAVDSRLQQIKPFQTGEVYNFTKRIAENGANDYWESGVVFPDKILADLIKIFHPELLPEHELIYYKQLQR